MSQALAERLNLSALPLEMPGKRIAELMDLRGKVTAGGGFSLGQACVNRPAGLGAAVAIIDINMAAAERVAAEVAARWDVETFAIFADVSTLAGAMNAVAAVKDRFGKIDIWANNLGIPDSSYRFVEASEQDLEKSMSINLKAPVFCLRAVLDVMLPQGAGRIINITSESSKRATAISVMYSSCKAGGVGFTRNLALELKGSGVTTVAVCPGVMMTEDIAGRYRAQPEADTPQGLLNGMDQVITERTSMAEEVANMVGFLATHAGCYVQTTAVSVGGGLSD